MNEDIMKNHREGILEDRAYRAAIFFENITIDTLKKIILESEKVDISKKRNMETPKRYEKTKHRRKQTFLTRSSGKGLFKEDTVLQEDFEEKWVNIHFENGEDWYNFSTKPQSDVEKKKERNLI